MNLHLTKSTVVLKLNEPIQAESFSRIVYFKNHDEHGLRIKYKFKKQDELTFTSEEIKEGEDGLFQILRSTDRSYLDHPRLLNRGGAYDLNIQSISMHVVVDIDGEEFEWSLLNGTVNKILEEDRHSISLKDCVTGIRANMASTLADKSGFEMAYSAQPEKLLKAFSELKEASEATLYNNIKDGKRYGWALSSREGRVDDIHGRRYDKYGLESEFQTPTPLYQGYFKEILEDLAPHVGPIYRARIIGINGFREILPHHDGHDGTKFYRYHIPLIPNLQCVFNVNGNDFVMEKVGQLYQFAAWETHSVVNYDGERVHLLLSGEKPFPI